MGAIGFLNIPAAGRNAQTKKVSPAVMRENARKAALHTLVQKLTPAGLVAVAESTTTNKGDVVEHLAQCPQCDAKYMSALRARYSQAERRMASVSAVRSLGLYLFKFYPETQAAHKFSEEVSN